MRYHNITKDDMLNGDGLRVVLWVAGCSHRCPGCQNPVTWDKDGGLPFGEPEKEELFQQLRCGYVSGITYSGGDPLHESNRDEVTALAREIRERFPDKTQWLYTGYLWEQVSDMPVMRYIDIMIDGRFVEAKHDPKLYWRGSSNQRIIDVKASINEGCAVLCTEKYETKNKLKDSIMNGGSYGGHCEL